jgi:hypothetical protein
MNTSSLEIVERHVIDSSRLFTWIQRSVNDDIPGSAYERDNTRLPAWYPDTSVGANPAGHTSGGVFQALAGLSVTIGQPIPALALQDLLFATVTLR